MGRDRQDPVAAHADDSEDLYGIAEWEVRTAFDVFVYLLYHLVVALFRAVVLLLAVSILLAQVFLTKFGAEIDPYVGALTVLSLLPALGLVVYVWYADVTTREPLPMLVATFLLGVLFAGFASIANSVAYDVMDSIDVAQTIALPVFFFVVVGPAEELVKMLAVRLFAYRHDRFDAVIDGAVYGAVAGLGFATIENAFYITGTIGATSGSLGAADHQSLAIFRTFVGPGHVVFSAFAGYYLGLAKFNHEHAVPIALKGLLIASVMHGTYNTLASYVPAVAETYGVDSELAFFAFVIVYVGILGTFLVHKFHRYARAYRRFASDTTDEPSAGES